MDSDLALKAISRALSGNWEEAIKLNKEILKDSPEDTDTLNRLAKAYFENGDIKKARSLSERVLRLDTFNSIAVKNLEKWKGLKSTKKSEGKPSQATDFIEEPGKTKLVTLLNPGDAKVMAKLNAGDEVKLSPHAHRVSISSYDGKYIGRLPDDLAARLIRLIKHGNAYQVLIKSIDAKLIKVFIKETIRSKNIEKTPSFPAEKIEYVAFTPPELVHKKDELGEGPEVESSEAE